MNSCSYKNIPILTFAWIALLGSSIWFVSIQSTDDRSVAAGVANAYSLNKQRQCSRIWTNVGGNERQCHYRMQPQGDHCRDQQRLMTLSRAFTRLYFSTSSLSLSSLTGWVIENLEESNGGTSDNVITSSSKTKAGENDTLPETGLAIGPFTIYAAEGDVSLGHRLMTNQDDGDDDDNDSNKGQQQHKQQQQQQQQQQQIPIRLLVGRNGWGTGVHPTTRLCLEWLIGIFKEVGSTDDDDDGHGRFITMNDSIDRHDGDHHNHHHHAATVFLDYGCGSGILSIAALHLGATHVIGVDIEAEALVTTQRNMMLNFGTSDMFRGLHTREVLAYELISSSFIIDHDNNQEKEKNRGVDICVANILIGQLIRPSMVVALVTNICPGGYLCFSGIRPGDQVQTLQAAYGDYLDFDVKAYAELAAVNTPGSIESYGYDCGTWARVVGRRRRRNHSDDDDNLVRRMSEMAVM